MPSSSSHLLGWSRLIYHSGMHTLYIISWRKEGRGEKKRRERGEKEKGRIRESAGELEVPASTQVINPEALSKYWVFMSSFTLAVLINLEILFAAWCCNSQSKYVKIKYKCKGRIVGYQLFSIELFHNSNRWDKQAWNSRLGRVYLFQY